MAISQYMQKILDEQNTADGERLIKKISEEVQAADDAQDERNQEAKIQRGFEDLNTKLNTVKNDWNEQRPNDISVRAVPGNNTVKVSTVGNGEFAVSPKGQFLEIKPMGTMSGKSYLYDCEIGGDFLWTTADSTGQTFESISAINFAERIVEAAVKGNVGPLRFSRVANK